MLGLLGPSELWATAPSHPLGMRLHCERRPQPGRVLCELELEVERGQLTWADLLVTEAPDFAPPLRARVGPEGVVMKTAQRQRLRLALAALAAGDGRLRVRARGVICPDDRALHCVPASGLVTARVAVGPIQSPGRDADDAPSEAPPTATRPEAPTR